jgi:hypothetical protein
MNNKFLSLVLVSSFAGLVLAEEAPKKEDSKAALVEEYGQVARKQFSRSIEITMGNMKEKLPKEVYDQTEKLLTSVLDSDDLINFVINMVDENFSEKEIKELLDIAKKDVTNKMLDVFAKSQFKMQEMLQEKFVKNMAAMAPCEAAKPVETNI